MTEKTIERECESCGGPFRIVPSRLKHGRGRHCSPACQYAAQRAKPKNALTFTCSGCGTAFRRYPSWAQRKGAGKFCSRACRDKHWVGGVTPNWQNGAGVYKRGPRWWAIRRRILKRDGACVHCGATERLHVHHKIPFRMFRCAGEANDLSNLVALCPPCHRKEDARFKWAATEGGHVMLFNAGGAAWELARERGLV